MERVFKRKFYDGIRANLSNNAREGVRHEQARKLLPELVASFSVTIAYHANTPNVGVAFEKDPDRYKLFLSDRSEVRQL